MKRVALSLLALALVVGGVAQAQADTISSLFDTGVNASGSPLPDGTIGDPHYQLVLVPAGSTTDIRVRTSTGGFPIPPYIGDDAISAWIGPNNASDLNSPLGNYDYQTTFNLAGLDPNTATITGGWSTDNVGVSILLNGVDTGNLPTGFTQFSSGFASFSITSGFQPGVNTLDFIVNNGVGFEDNPTAVRVEMTGTATATAVPEPSTFLLFGVGLAGVGILRSRFKI
jgi:hypothetical protein